MTTPRLAAYVPVPVGRLTLLIAEKRGRVGAPDADDAGRIVIDCEGNLYDAASVRIYADSWFVSLN